MVIRTRLEALTSQQKFRQYSHYFHMSEPTSESVWKPDFEARASSYLTSSFKFEESHEAGIMLSTAKSLLTSMDTSLKKANSSTADVAKATVAECRVSINANLRYFNVKNLLHIVAPGSEAQCHLLCNEFNVGLNKYKESVKKTGGNTLQVPEIKVSQSSRPNSPITLNEMFTNLKFTEKKDEGKTEETTNSAAVSDTLRSLNETLSTFQDFNFF